MKLGLILEHYDGRNDVRELVRVLSKQSEVVVFAAEEKLAGIVGPFERRAFRRAVRFRHRFWSQLFNFAGAIPASRDNFFITELFKLAELRSIRRRFASFRLKCRLALPSLMSFDALLDRLDDSDETPIDDIDRFLIITELSSPHFLARVLRSGKPVDAYVYSWDHPCKHARISHRVDRWFVWNRGIAEDLHRLHGIPVSQVFVVGSTQLSFVREYLRDEVRKVPMRAGPYLYYGCGVGHSGMAEQEARLVEFLADCLNRAFPSMTLLVRPYPHLQNAESFSYLKARRNVEFDDAYRLGRHDLSLTRAEIYARLNLQEYAAAFVHCGTTMGLECSYLPTPVLFLAMDDFDYGVPAAHSLHLRRFIHQYHNEKYMMQAGSPNVVRRARDLEQALKRLITAPMEFMDYSTRIVNDMPLRGLDNIANDLMWPDHAAAYTKVCGQ